MYIAYTGVMLEISVIIPAYNEESRLPQTLRSVHEFLQTTGRKFEIVIVDDGSSDGTAAVVRVMSQQYPGVRLVSYKQNRGKGHAVRVGIMAAEGELLLIDDADGSSPINELTRLERAIAEGADVAIGSRAKPDPHRVVQAQAHRKYIGNTFNLIVQSLLLKGIYDTQCGFKLFRKPIARDIFSVATLDGFGFDVEVLYIAKLRGYKTEEVAINWSSVDGSKVNVFIDSPKMLAEVVGIKYSALRGRYRKLPAPQPAPMGVKV